MTFFCDVCNEFTEFERLSDRCGVGNRLWAVYICIECGHELTLAGI